MDKNIPENYKITFKSSRVPGNYGPHNIYFPNQISKLKLIMGLKQDFSLLVNNDIYDNDYFFQLGLSGEAFTLLYTMPETVKSQRWGIKPLKAS